MIDRLFFCFVNRFMDNYGLFYNDINLITFDINI